MILGDEGDKEGGDVVAHVIDTTWMSSDYLMKIQVASRSQSLCLSGIKDQESLIVVQDDVRVSNASEFIVDPGEGMVIAPLDESQFVSLR